MDLKLFGDKLPERHVYLATEGRQYSLKDIKREFGSWNNYVLEFEAQAAKLKAATIKVEPKVVTDVIPKQTT